MSAFKPSNNLLTDTVLFEAIAQIREKSDYRREVEAYVLEQNGLASVRQLSEDKKRLFTRIVDAIINEGVDDVDPSMYVMNEGYGMKREDHSPVDPGRYKNDAKPAAKLHNALGRHLEKNQKDIDEMTGFQALRQAAGRKDAGSGVVGGALRKVPGAAAGLVKKAAGAAGSALKTGAKKAGEAALRGTAQMVSTIGRAGAAAAGRPVQGARVLGGHRVEEIDMDEDYDIQEAAKKHPVGSKVRIHLPGSDVHGQIGTVQGHRRDERLGGVHDIKVKGGSTMVRDSAVRSLDEDYDIQELKDSTVKRAIKKAEKSAEAAKNSPTPDRSNFMRMHAYRAQADRLTKALERKKRRQKAEKYEPSAAKTRGIVKRNQAIEKHNRDMKRDSRGGSDDEETAAKEAAWRNDPIRRRRMEQGK